MILKKLITLISRYFNIKVNAGEYAWKPVIIKECFDTFCDLYNDHIVLWMVWEYDYRFNKKNENLIKNNNIYNSVTSGGILKNNYTI